MNHPNTRIKPGRHSSNTRKGSAQAQQRKIIKGSRVGGSQGKSMRNCNSVKNVVIPFEAPSPPQKARSAYRGFAILKRTARRERKNTNTKWIEQLEAIVSEPDAEEHQDILRASPWTKSRPSENMFLAHLVDAMSAQHYKQACTT